MVFLAKPAPVSTKRGQGDELTYAEYSINTSLAALPDVGAPICCPARDLIYWS
jgi:hypothetical protein